MLLIAAPSAKPPARDMCELHNFTVCVEVEDTVCCCGSVISTIDMRYITLIVSAKRYRNMSVFSLGLHDLNEVLEKFQRD